jgi:uncharacterized membrane protein
MTATFAPPSWPAPVPPAWRFGRAWAGDGASQGARADIGTSAASGIQWVLCRNRSITPRQMGAVYLSLCLLSMLIAAGFAWYGAPVVLAYAGLELAAVGLAMLVYARHARDGDTLTLAGPWLAVDQSSGGRVHRTEFRAEWVSVEPSHGEGSLIQLSGQGRQVRIGRFLRRDHRPALAQEIRAALRSVRGSAPSLHDHQA